MSRQRWHPRTRRDARGMAAPAAGWTPGPYPFGFAHSSGYGAVPPVAHLEAAGWQRVGAVPGLVGLFLMRRDTGEGA
jgi:hypothetical protein